MRDEITFAGITFDVEYHIEKGEKRAKEFTWEKAAKQTIELYKSLLR